MDKQGGPGTDDRGLVPPHTRLAVPGDDADFRIIDITEDSFGAFSSRVVDLLATALQLRCGVFPGIAVRELADNLIHAVPCTASLVLDPSYGSLFISDTGPGIPNPNLAFELGYSTATELHRSFIRGVGIGLYLAREDVRSCGGDLRITSSPGGGTFVHVILPGVSTAPRPGAVGGEVCLDQRQNNVLFLLSEGESLGPSGVAAELNIGVSTAHRILVGLQDVGFVYTTSNGKRFLSESGKSYLQSILSL